jgi:hypothetical protein
MSTKDRSSPSRWTQRSAGDLSAGERQAASLLQAADSEPLDDTALQRLARRLAARQADPRPGWRSWAVATAAFILIVLAAGAVVARTRIGATLGERIVGLLSVRARARTVPTSLSPASKGRPARRAAEPSTGEKAALAMVRPAPPSAADSTPSPSSSASPAGSPLSSPRPSTAAPPAPLAQEAELLARALLQIGPRDEPREAKDALATLDRYRIRFPDGLLREEANRARVTALLRLGRSTEALSELETGPSAALLRRADEVLRGELRAQSGRCGEALEDFHRLLTAMPRGTALDPEVGDLRERCLYGRAMCLARTDRPAEARVELRAYLAEYPSGHFVAQTRAALSERAPVR